MSLQTKKEKLIAYISELKDENIINELEIYIQKRQTQKDAAEFKPFTEEDLIERIQKSEEDYRNGRFMTQSELEEVSSKW